MKAIGASQLSNPGKNKKENQLFEITAPFAASQLWWGEF